MAIIKVINVKKTPYKNLKYITNNNKTLNGSLVSGLSGSKDIKEIIKKMKNINQQYGKDNQVKMKHIIHSFHKDEKITPYEAHLISMEWYKEMFPDLNCVGIIATHSPEINSTNPIEKCIHTHISLNAITTNGYRINTDKKWIEKAINISNELCKKHELKHSFISMENAAMLRKSNIEFKMECSGKITFKSLVKKDLDELIPKVKDYNEFLKCLKEKGYDIKDGKELRIANETYGMKKRMQTTRLGEYYSKKYIIQRIHENNKLKDSYIKVVKLRNKKSFNWVPLEEYKLKNSKATLANNLKLLIMLLSNKKKINNTKKHINNNKIIFRKIKILTKALETVENNKLIDTESCYKSLNKLLQEKRFLDNKKIKNTDLLKQIEIMNNRINELTIQIEELKSYKVNFISKIRHKNKINSLSTLMEELNEYDVEKINKQKSKLQEELIIIEKSLNENSKKTEDINFVLDVTRDVINKDKFKDTDKER